MKLNNTTIITVVLAFLLGIGISLAVTHLTQAKNPAYLLAEVDIKDYEGFAKYCKGSSKIIKNHGGKYLIRGGEITSLEGDWNPGRVVLIKFDNMEKAQNCLNSAEYLKLKFFRDSTSSSKAILMEGCTKK